MTSATDQRRLGLRASNSPGAPSHRVPLRSAHLRELGCGEQLAKRSVDTRDRSGAFGVRLFTSDATAQPVIRGTRVLLRTVLSYLAHGSSSSEVVAEFPS